MQKQPPSVQAVIAFYEGSPQSLNKVLGTFIGRGVMLALGYHYLSDTSNPLKMGFLGSAIIETYLLWYFRQK